MPLNNLRGIFIYGRGGAGGGGGRRGALGCGGGGGTLTCTLP